MNEDNLIPIFERDLARIAHMFTIRETKVMELLYGLNGQPQCTFEEIGHRYGVTPERIKQIRDRAVSIIRDLPPDAC